MWGDGVLTLEKLDNLFGKITQSHGKPTNGFIISPHAYNDMMEWQKKENWFKSLGPRREKTERLRDKLKHRNKHKIVKLPE